MLKKVLLQAVKTGRAQLGSILVRTGVWLLDIDESVVDGFGSLADDDDEEDESTVLPHVTLSDWAKQAVADGARPRPPAKKTNGASHKPLTGSIADRVARARRASQE